MLLHIEEIENDRLRSVLEDIYSDELHHFGVKGMRRGVRKQLKYSDEKAAFRQAKLEKKNAKAGYKMAKARKRKSVTEYKKAKHAYNLVKRKLKNDDDGGDDEVGYSSATPAMA